jgi:MFS family permease
LGWPVFAYGLAGALTGFVAGAQLGALIGQLGGAAGTGLGSGGSLGTISKMVPKFAQQLTRMASTRSWIYAADGTVKATTVTSFLAGFVSGGVTATFTPKEQRPNVSAAALATYTGTNVLITGYRWVQKHVLGMVPFVPGGIELATMYITGFELGYVAASTIRSQIEGAR